MNVRVFLSTALSGVLFLLGFSWNAHADYDCAVKDKSGDYQFIVRGKDLDHLKVQINKKNAISGRFENKASIPLGEAGNRRQFYSKNDEDDLSILYGYEWQRNGWLGFGWNVTVQLKENENGLLFLHINPAIEGKWGKKIRAKTNLDAGERCSGPSLPE